MINRESADAWLRDGCGRCDNYATPRCKVHRWHGILEPLRAELLRAGLVEEMKWGSPTYSVDGGIVVMLVSLLDCCALSFWKGSALHDPDGLLEVAGPNTQHGRLLKLRSVEEWGRKNAGAVALIAQAIAVERSGLRLAPLAAPEIPVELAQRLEADPHLREAWDALTPGRRRSHIIQVQGGKQAETRTRRVEKCVPLILAGRGFLERDERGLMGTLSRPNS
jgi:uncharacterized protein YdeI (YjbR/CyaY-like superfamily)